MENGENETHLVYRCACGFQTPELKEFRSHLVWQGKAEPGVHRSAGKWDPDTGEQVERPWWESRRKGKATLDKEELDMPPLQDGGITEGMPKAPKKGKGGDGRSHLLADGAEKEMAFVAVRGGRPAVVFAVGDEHIPLEASDLYVAYIIYLDLRARAGIENTFTDTLKYGMETIWSLMLRPRITEGGVISYGGCQGDEAVGADRAACAAQGGRHEENGG